MRNSKIYELYYKTFKFNLEKKHLLIYLTQGVKHGSSVAELLESILHEYEKTKMFKMHDMITKTIYYMEEEGLETGDAFFNSGLFTDSEKITFNAIAKSSIDQAFEQINKQNKYRNDLKYAISMLVLPVLFVLLGYIIFMPEIKSFAESLLEPVNSVSTTKIPLPAYFSDRTIFVVAFFSIILISFAFYYFVEWGKKNNPRLVFKSLKLLEREFVLNNFNVILQLMNSGLSLSRAVETINKDPKCVLTKRIFGEAEIEMNNGNSFSSVIEKYLTDYATIAFLKSGEDTNQIESSLSMIISHNEVIHQKTISRLVVWLPMAGEIVMTIVLLLPLLDILNTTTIGAMNFTV